MIRTTCPSCGAELTIPDEYAGKAGRCGHCGGRFVAPDAVGMPPPPPVPPGHPLFPGGEGPRRKGQEPPPKWLGWLAIVFGGIVAIGGALFGLIGVVVTCCVPAALPLMGAVAGLAHIAAGVACLKRDLASGRALRVTAVAAGIAQLIVSALGCVLAEFFAVGPFWGMEGDPPLSGPEAARFHAALALVLAPLVLWMGYVVLVFWVTSRKDDRL